MHNADEVELRWGVWNPVSHLLRDSEERGRLAEIVVGLGERSSSELARELGVARSEVEAVVDQLVSLGAVASEPETALDHYLDCYVPALRAGATDRGSEVVVVGRGGLGPELAEVLAAPLGPGRVSWLEADDPRWQILLSRDEGWLSDGVLFHERLAAFEGWQGRLVVVAQEIVDPMLGRVANRLFHELAIPWLHGAVDGPFLFVGPTMVPPSSACYECFEQRVLMNLRERQDYLRYKTALALGRARHPAGPLDPILGGLLRSHLAFEALNYAATGRSFTVGRVLSLYLPTMELAFSDVLKMPGCAACGSNVSRDAEELYFSLRSVIEEGAP